MRLTYQSTHENMRARLNWAFGITGQASAPPTPAACHEPTKPRRLQRNLEAGATVRTDARKDHARDLKSLAGGSSMSSVSEDIKPVDGGPVSLINVFEVALRARDRGRLAVGSDRRHGRRRAPRQGGGGRP